MSNEIFIIIAKNIKLMGVWILACERRPISVRRISPPAKVTFWISDKTLFFLFYTIQWLPTSHLRLFVFPIGASAKREWHARVTGDEVQWTMGRMKKRGEATSRPFSRSRPYIVVSCKLISFSRWLEGIRNQSPQSVGAARCSTSDWGQERHEICYERYFC